MSSPSLMQTKTQANITAKFLINLVFKKAPILVPIYSLNVITRSYLPRKCKKNMLSPNVCAFFLLATSLLKDRSIYVCLTIPTQKLCIKSHHTNISHYFHVAAEEKDNEKEKKINIATDDMCNRISNYTLIRLFNCL